LPEATSAAPPAQQPSCTSCAGGRLARDNVRTALWQGDDLVIVEGIPALVCQSCGERYFEDETAMALDFMRGGGLEEGTAIRRVSVPVFAYAPPGSGPEEGRSG